MAQFPWKKTILIGVWELLILALFAIGLKLAGVGSQPVLMTTEMIRFESSIPNTRVLPTIAATPSPTFSKIPELKPSSTSLPTATPIPTFTRYIMPTRTETSVGSTGTVPIPVDGSTGTVPIPVGNSTGTVPIPVDG